MKQLTPHPSAPQLQRGTLTSMFAKPSLHPLVRRFFSSSRVRRWLLLRDVVPMSARQLQIWQEHAEEKANHYMTCNAPDMEEYYRGEADCLKKLARLWIEHGRWTSSNVPDETREP